MKKIYILAFICCMFQMKSNAQSLILSTGFDNYAGTVATIPAGWYMSWNTSNSFYTSTGNYGLAAPSYKLGNDSDIVVAPFTASAQDSVSFFVRGNGTPFSPANELQIFQSQDSITWTLVASIDSLPTTGTTIGVNLNGDSYFKLLYIKQPAGGNLAIDDIKIFSYITSDNQMNDEVNVNVFPSPSSGMVFIKLPENQKSVSLEFYDMLGNRINNLIANKRSNDLYAVDFTGMRNGFYFIKIKSGSSIYTKRITIIN
jgi:hypothetical protein